MRRDIFFRLFASVVIIFLMFSLHRAITVGPRPQRTALAHDRPVVIALRGGAGLAPENTLVAFQNAADLGVDIIDLDVRLSADGELVVIDDASVDRTTDGTGQVSAMTVAELKTLDAGYRFSSDDGATFPYRGQGVTIPTLDEALAAFPQQRFNIEIKDFDVAAADRLADVLAATGSGNRVIVTSLEDTVLRRFRDRAPDVATSASPRETEIFYLLQSLGLTKLHRPLGDIYELPARSGRFVFDTASFVQNAHQLNQQVVFEAGADPAEMQRLIELGADGILTDRPDLALAIGAAQQND